MEKNKDLSKGVFFKDSLGQDLRSDMVKRNVWSKECPVTLDRLSLLTLSYINNKGESFYDGQMVVFDVIADKVLLVFQELFIRRFPINSIRLINEFFGDDNKSLEVNNTSCFNGRKIVNSTKWSVHSYGMAIDINPMQNPCLDTEYQDGKKEISVLPPRGMNFVNRNNVREGMVESIINESTGLTVVDLFKENGFVWGGEWNFPIDWHHFQIPTEAAKKLMSMSFEEGQQYFISILQKK